MGETSMEAVQTIMVSVKCVQKCRELVVVQCCWSTCLCMRCDFQESYTGKGRMVAGGPFPDTRSRKKKVCCFHCCELESSVVNDLKGS